MNRSDVDRDPWGLRAPTRPPERRPSHTPEEVARLARLIQAEPDIAGRLRDVEVSELQARGSGATMLYGTWGGTTGPAHADALGTDAGKAPVSRSAIVKLGATEREVHWATRLSRHAPDLVPYVYASGYALGGEPVPWLVMERCPYRLDYTWGHQLYTMVMDAGVRFHLAARQIAPPVGPADVPLAWHFDRVRRAVKNDPPAPGPAGRVADRLADDWAWVLAVCRVEFAHGDLHLNNAVWRKAPPDPDAKALLVDYWPNPAPWATEPAYCQVVYWPSGTGHPVHPTLVHEMAALRTAYGLEVPAPADVDRLATLFLAWNALYLWPGVTHRHGVPDYVVAVARWIEQAASWQAGQRADVGAWISSRRQS